MFQPLSEQNYRRLTYACDENLDILKETIKTRPYMDNYIVNEKKLIIMERIIFKNLFKQNPDKKKFDLIMHSYEKQIEKLYEIATDLYSRGIIGDGSEVKKNIMENMEMIKGICLHTGIYDL